MPLSAAVVDALFASPHVKVALMDHAFRFLRVNDAYAKAGRRAPEWFEGRRHFDLYPCGEAEAIFRRVRDTGEPYVIRERPFVYPDQQDRGTTYWDWSLHPIAGAEGDTECLLLSLVEVTERVRARRLAAERELLIKELNHRVKNNLQIVASLATLQAAAHPEAAGPPMAFGEKVHTIGRVHERLAFDPDLATIDMQAQLEDLCTGLAEAHGREGVGFQVAARARTPVDEAMPLSLLVAELVLNALKHSFPDGRAGRIEVLVHRIAGGRCALCVRDDGIGGARVPDEAAKSLGLRIVEALARQIEGALSVRSPRNAGTEWRIEFPCPPGCVCELPVSPDA